MAQLVCAQADTYKLPITATASLSMDASYYPAEWVENVPYDFWANPSVLRVGYDAATNKVYDSALYFDWSALSFIPEGAPITVAFCWTPVTQPSPDEALFAGFGDIEPPGPDPLDFNWWVLREWNPTYPLAQPDRTPTFSPGIWRYVCPQEGILLLGYQRTCLTEIAGINYGQGYEAPCVLVTYVPEPPAWFAVGLLAGVLCLAAHARREKRMVESRKLFALMSVVGLLLVLSMGAGATTYELPVRTATLAVQADHYGEFVDGVPAGPYEFWIDPPVLRVGRDASTNLMYNSYVMFDAAGFSQVPPEASIYYGLYLATAWVPSGVTYYQGSLAPWADTPVPELSDFDWSGQFGESMWSPEDMPVGQTLHFVYGPTAVPPVSSPTYMGWLLIPGYLYGDAPVEIAGPSNPYGMASPHILVTVVPEPPALLCLGAGAVLLGLRSARRSRWACWLVLAAIRTGGSGCAETNAVSR